MARKRWKVKSRNSWMLHGLLEKMMPVWSENEPYWKIFEGIEDYFINLEKNRETDKGDKKNVL